MLKIHWKSAAFLPPFPGLPQPEWQTRRALPTPSESTSALLLVSALERGLTRTLQVVMRARPALAETLNPRYTLPSWGHSSLGIFQVTFLYIT